MITFQASAPKLNGPRIDGNYTVSFNTGEYEKQQLADLLMLPKDEEVYVMVVTQDEYDKHFKEKK